MQTLSLNHSSIPSPTSPSRPEEVLESPVDRSLSSSRAHRSNPNFARLPPLITSPTTRAPPTPRPSSQASLGDKFFSARTHFSGPQNQSRPHSNVFPVFHSSLSHTLVRDFAWPPEHPHHYGTQSHVSRSLSPAPHDEEASEQESDGAEGSWYGVEKEHKLPGRLSGPRLPATSFNDGPPWSEDEDLLSPIVTTSKHKRGKSGLSDVERTPGRNIAQGALGESPEEPQQRRHSADNVGGDVSWQADPQHQPDASYFALGRGPTYAEPPVQFGSEDEPTPLSGDEDETSRYSRDYQFTIASPDEEMHGKAVALFDFARENENELPLLEGQVLWVSYRHGQGWLVAQDPKSGESGLVPEEYVRLLKDIEGGWNRLQGIEGPEWEGSPIFNMSSGDSPISAFHERTGSGTSGNAGSWPTSGDGALPAQHYTPVQSHFSTSSKDLERYPQHRLLVASQSQTYGNTVQVVPSPTSDFISPAVMGGVQLQSPTMETHPGQSFGALAQPHSEVNPSPTLIRSSIGNVHSPKASEGGQQVPDVLLQPCDGTDQMEKPSEESISTPEQYPTGLR